MKNVLIFALAGGRYAVELRWVREILSLGHLTPVPTAPAIVAGAMNFKGAIVPVLGGAALFGGNVPLPPEKLRSPRTGDSVILIDVDGMRAALAAERIDEVTTLVAATTEAGGAAAGPDALMDTRGRIVPLLDPVAILGNARAQISSTAAAAQAPFTNSGKGGDGAR